MLEMDHNVVDEAILDSHERGPDHEEDDVEEPVANFTDSEDDVNDDDFMYDCDDPDRIAVGLNSDPIVEEQHIDAIGEDDDSDDSYDPTMEKLNTNYSSEEEIPVRYPIFNEEKELWDPQFEVGKTFTDVPQFRKAIQNHGIATGCNLRLKANDEKIAQAVCKLGCN
ncbi:Uncharacterized protein Adt_08477 [Abeliophyllum distichum]|uniref:Transposase MuDR plant domain-containing protein n=1 Tax=Abeliophyllum distichum TaxID=126358 RepID=A0ABD1VCR1_9LAMI